LLPVKATFSAFTTTTKSPVSMCGVKVGLCLPRSTRAMSLASRPTGLFAASTMNQDRSISEGLAV
jgi:hypothetical protein